MAFWQNTAFDENHGFRDFRDYLLSLYIYIYYEIVHEVQKSRMKNKTF